MQDLINEHLKIYGIEVYYLPRKVFKTDDIIREVQSSKFDESFAIEAYLNNYEGYAPGADLMTKFGIQLKNEVSLTISRERYEEFIEPFTATLRQGILEGDNPDPAQLLLVTRPSEGDLIYFPLGERLFEIKRVEFERPFYQLGKNYVYELQCELYEFENEQIDTSIDEIDSTVDDEGYITTLRLTGLGSTATADATVSFAGAIQEIVLLNDGFDYIGIPTVTISPPLLGGVQAEAIAITTSVFGSNSVKEIQLTNSGSGYSQADPPTISIQGGGGSNAEAIPIIANSPAVQQISIGNSGSDYVNPPVVRVRNPDVGTGVTATAVAFVNEDGNISNINITNAGSGYLSIPPVIIDPPPVSGLGTFIYNEKVIGETSKTEAFVRNFKQDFDVSEFNAPAELEIAINTGEFIVGETIVGTISSAKYVISEYNTFGTNPYDQNEEFEIEGDKIIDFSERNPFGEL